MFSITRINSNTYTPRVLQIYFTNISQLVVFLHLIKSIRDHLVDNISQDTFTKHIEIYLPPDVKVPHYLELVEIFNSLWFGGLQQFHDHCVSTLKQPTVVNTVELSSYIQYNHMMSNPPPTNLQLTIKTTAEGIFWFYLLACLPDSVDPEDIKTEVPHNDIATAILHYIGTTQSTTELAKELVTL